MLYLAGWDETLFKMSEDELLQMYNENQDKIQSVKGQVMEHLESVEEARRFVQLALEKLDLEEIAAELDAENEQDNADNEGLEEMDEELIHLDQDVQEDNGSKSKPSIYRPIDLSQP